MLRAERVAVCSSGSNCALAILLHPEKSSITSGKVETFYIFMSSFLYFHTYI